MCKNRAADRIGTRSSAESTFLPGRGSWGMPGSRENPGIGGGKGIEGEKGLKEKGEKEKRNLRRWRTGLKEKREKRI